MQLITDKRCLKCGRRLILWRLENKVVTEWVCPFCKHELEMEMAESKANDIQIGGEHYKTGGEEHWDRAWRLKYDCFQYIITKWIERWRDKGGIEDLRKARHAVDKYIEVAMAEEEEEEKAKAANPGAGYVGQD